jgi:NAD(P)H-dependent FMN reductase
VQHRRVLVVCFSRTGRTRSLAEQLARELDATLEVLLDRTSRAGRVGYLRCSRDALLRRAPDIAPLSRDLAQYDLVLIGTPVWNASPCAPVRTFLRRERARLPAVAFFLSHGGFGARRVFAAMTALAGRAPLATLAIRARHFERGEVEARARGFAAVLRGPRAEHA